MSYSDAEEADPEEVTRLLAGIGRGDAAAAILPLVYEELRRLAQQRMSHEPPGTLQATALVHEAYLRLVRDPRARWENRGHFFAAAAEAMRRILVEHARERRTLKRGGERQRVPLDLVGDPLVPASPVDLLALDDALVRLEAHDARKSQIVKLRFFAGCTIEETSDLLGLSPATVKADWSYAKAWLHRELFGAEADAGSGGAP